MSESYMEAVSDLASLTGDFAMSHYGRELAVDVKQDGSRWGLRSCGARVESMA